jgi:hypothetical protein
MRKRIISFIENGDSHAWSRFSTTAWFGREGVKVFEVSTNTPTSFGLPVVIIEETVLGKTIKEPFVCRNIETLTSEAENGKIAEIGLLEMFGIWVIFTNGSDSSGR